MRCAPFERARPGRGPLCGPACVPGCVASGVGAGYIAYTPSVESTEGAGFGDLERSPGR